MMHGRPLSIALAGSIAFVVAFVSGCASTPSRTGFLTDYSRLQQDGSDLRWADDARLAVYSKFIVEPASIHFHAKAKGKGTDQTTLRRMANTMNDAVIRELSGRYSIVSQPGPGVARIRIAITDVRKDTPALNVIPQTRMTGLGLGGASMEGEVLDSQTGEQIGAVIQSDQGKRISLSGFKRWSSAEAVIKEWAKRFRKRLDEAHGE